jgi:hypothetical protein
VGVVTRISKSEVSLNWAELDDRVAAFRGRSSASTTRRRDAGPSVPDVQAMPEGAKDRLLAFTEHGADLETATSVTGRG